MVVLLSQVYCHQWHFYANTRDIALDFLISSFKSSYYFSNFSTETNSWWLIFESIRALEIKTSLVFNLVFANKTALSCCLFFFLIIEFYFLIPAVIKEIFIVLAELAIPTGIPTKEVRAGIETHPVTVEVRISKCSI